MARPRRTTSSVRPTFCVLVDSEPVHVTTRLGEAVALVAVRARAWLRDHAARVAAGPARDCVRVDCIDGPAIRTCAPVVLRRADGPLTQGDWDEVGRWLRSDVLDDDVRRIERREARAAAQEGAA